MQFKASFNRWLFWFIHYRRWRRNRRRGFGHRCSSCSCSCQLSHRGFSHCLFDACFFSTVGLAWLSFPAQRLQSFFNQSTVNIFNAARGTNLQAHVTQIIGLTQNATGSTNDQANRVVHKKRRSLGTRVNQPEIDVFLGIRKIQPLYFETPFDALIQRFHVQSLEALNKCRTTKQEQTDGVIAFAGVVGQQANLVEGFGVMLLHIVNYDHKTSVGVGIDMLVNYPVQVFFFAVLRHTIVNSERSTDTPEHLLIALHRRRDINVGITTLFKLFNQLQAQHRFTDTIVAGNHHRRLF